MCPPNVVAALSNTEVTRRNLFKLGLGAAAATVAALPAARTHAAEVRPVSFSNVMDLTHVLGPGSPGFPGLPGFEIKQYVSHEQNGFFGNVLTYWEHNGTHLDAPIHFAPKGLFVDQIPAESFIAPAVVINIKERAARDPDTVVTADDILAWERRYGRLPNNAVVLMNSGWATRFGSVQQYRNTDNSNVSHFPGFGEEAITFLLTERSINGIGVDTLSLDPGVAQQFVVHTALLSTNRYGIENVANLDSMPPSGATLFVGAPKVAGGSGGPSRVMAVW